MTTPYNPATMFVTYTPLTATVDFATPSEARTVKQQLNCWSAVIANGRTRRYELVLSHAEFARLTSTEEQTR